MKETDEDIAKYPRLGRWISWIERAGSVEKLIFLLVLACVSVVLLDITYEKYGHFAEEQLIGFYAVFGFVSFTGLILAARGLRHFLIRPEDFYKDAAIDHEESYPDEGTDVKEHE